MSIINPKVAIIGTGHVGASTAFTMALNNVVKEIVLIDIDKNKAFGEMLDINYGFAFKENSKVRQGEYSDCHDSDIIIITAGINRKAGQSRLDLINENILVIKDVADNIEKHYHNSIILMVTNPVDILTYLIHKWYNFPRKKVFGTGTILDTSRFRSVLSNKLNVDLSNIHGYVLGEHGDSQVISWSSTHISGQSFDQYCAVNNILMSENDKKNIEQEVKSTGATIIKGKGATYFSIAVLINTIVEKILKNSNSILTVSSMIDEIYGINEVVISLPTIINSTGVSQVLKIELAPNEEIALQRSAEIIKEYINKTIKDPMKI